MKRWILLLLCCLAGTAHAAGWAHVGRIDSPCCFAGSHDGMKFGTAIAADLYSGSLRALYVGAPGFSMTDGSTVIPEAGIVFVFAPTNEGWQLVTYLQPVQPQPFGHFGEDVAVASGVVAIGEPGFDTATHADAGRITLL